MAYWIWAVSPGVCDQTLGNLFPITRFYMFKSYLPSCNHHNITNNDHQAFPICSHLRRPACGRRTVGAVGARPVIGPVARAAAVADGGTEGTGQVAHGPSRGACQDRELDLKIGDPGLPSGNLLHNYGKSPCLTGKSTINGHFQ